LWLLPLMLRFALLEQLHHRSIEVARRQHERGSPISGQTAASCRPEKSR
jgi:hypothetical protein